VQIMKIKEIIKDKKSKRHKVTIMMLVIRFLSLEIIQK